MKIKLQDKNNSTYILSLYDQHKEGDCEITPIYMEDLERYRLFFVEIMYPKLYNHIMDYFTKKYTAIYKKTNIHEDDILILDLILVEDTIEKKYYILTNCDIDITYPKQDDDIESLYVLYGNKYAIHAELDQYEIQMLSI